MRGEKILSLLIMVKRSLVHQIIQVIGKSHAQYYASSLCLGGEGGSKGQHQSYLDSNFRVNDDGLGTDEAEDNAHEDGLDIDNDLVINA